MYYVSPGTSDLGLKQADISCLCRFPNKFCLDRFCQFLTGVVCHSVSQPCLCFKVSILHLRLQVLPSFPPEMTHLFIMMLSPLAFVFRKWHSTSTQISSPCRTVSRYPVTDASQISFYFHCFGPLYGLRSFRRWPHSYMLKSISLRYKRHQSVLAIPQLSVSDHL